MVRKSKNRMIANEKVLTFNALNRFSFAGSFAEMQTSASGTNAFCLQPSLQSQKFLQSVCKENRPKYQLLMKRLFAPLFAVILN